MLLIALCLIIKVRIKEIIVCGGGRKNKFLIKKLKNLFSHLDMKFIDSYNLDGDFIESQAFAF